ncbi:MULTISPECIES: hypothetical protein [Lelliottia]|uniref:hypothetical protein n=1 Tax=Lelliottia TaxID=1330545 RepID=UPI002D76CE24|nr:hypothetical protein [Lelliottia sp. JS-SCA-14]
MKRLKKCLTIISGSSEVQELRAVLCQVKQVVKGMKKLVGYRDGDNIKLEMFDNLSGFLPCI